MAKTKAELLKQLEVLGYDVATLEGKTKAELEVMVKESANEEVNQEETGEPTDVTEVNQVEEGKPESEPVVEGTVICEGVIKLRVHDTRVINLYPTSSKVVIENLGGGDAYVSGDVLRLSIKDVVRPGGKKVIENTNAIIVRASSRPTLKITQLM